MSKQLESDLMKTARLLVLRLRSQIPASDTEGISLWEQWEGALMLGMQYAQEPLAVKSANDHLEALLAHLKKITLASSVTLCHRAAHRPMNKDEIRKAESEGDQMAEDVLARRGPEVFARIAKPLALVTVATLGVDRKDLEIFREEIGFLLDGCYGTEGK